MYDKIFRSVLVSTATEAERKLPVKVRKYEVRYFSVFRKFGKKSDKKKQNIFRNKSINPISPGRDKFASAYENMQICKQEY